LSSRLSLTSWPTLSCFLLLPWVAKVKRGIQTCAVFWPTCTSTHTPLSSRC
ncbi:hypothetical protein COCMIDRAFT_95190, partial [Bipolaris oryzae ATCC 44560]